MTKIISFFNHKGGCSKSSSSVNVATILSQKGHSTLLIDCDAQGNSSLSFGMYQKEINIKDVMLDEIPIENAIYKYEKLDNLYILPSNLHHAKTELTIFNYPNRERILTNAIKSIKQNFEYIIIDCPPSLGLISINALAASTHILIPMKIGKYNLMGIKALYDTIAVVKKHFNENIVLSGFFITQDEPNTNIAKETKLALAEQLSDKILSSVISRTVKMVESETQEIPLVLYAKDNKVAKEYIELTEEVIERVK